MNFQPPIRGKKLKKKDKPIPTLGEFAGAVGNVGQLTQELRELKDEVIEVVDFKLEEVDTKVQEKIDSITPEVIKGVQAEVVSLVKKIKTGPPGKVDEAGIISYLESRIPTIESIVERVPKVDEKALTKRVLQTIPANKESLKIIQKTFQLDPMSVIEKIMAMGDKFKLKPENIDGLQQTISAFHNQLGRGYLHGGGDTVVAGSNITITANANGTKTISSTAVGGVTSISATGEPQLTGTVTLSEGSNIILTQVGNDIEISASGGGTPGGADTQVQFNDAGAFGGDADLTYSKITDTLSVFDVSVNGAVRFPSGGLIDSDASLEFDITNDLEILAGGQIFIAGPSSASYLDLDGDDTELLATNLLEIESLGNSTVRFRTNDGKYKFFNGALIAGLLNFSSLAASDKTFTFPNVTGTLALLQTANAFTVGGQSITVADAANVVGLTVTQNDTTNFPYIAQFISTESQGVLIQNNDTEFEEARLDFFNNFQVTGSNDLGGIRFFSLDSTPTRELMAEIITYVVDNTTTSEDSVIKFATRLAGSSAVTRMTLGDGINGLKVGASTANGIISSNGNQDLILQTGNVTTGNITLADGADGSITVNVNGNGAFEVNATSGEINLRAEDMAFFASSSYKFWSGTGGVDGFLDFTALNTSDKSFTFPNASGTIMLLPAVPADYTLSNVTTDRTLNANATTIDELADVLGTLIGDLTTLGLLQ